MMELGDAAGDVFEVKLRFCINEPGFTAVRPENRQLQSNCEEMAGWGGIRLVYSVCGQGWIFKHSDAEKQTNTLELGYRLL